MKRKNIPLKNKISFKSLLVLNSGGVNCSKLILENKTFKTALRRKNPSLHKIAIMSAVKIK
jgi:hypothetical protein